MLVPVARLESVRIMIALVAHKGWSIHHMNVKSALLKGELQDKMYVSQPAGFVVGGKDDKMLRFDKQDSTGISMNQTAYSGKILEKSGMKGCNPCLVFTEPWFKLSRMTTASTTDATTYWSIVGSLRYLVHTRLDIAYSVGYLSRFMEASTTEHLAAVKHILWYIARTQHYGCQYGRKNVNVALVGYSDSDMAGDIDTRKSTTNVLFFLGKSIISWQSHKQKVVRLSSCKAVYIAAATAAC
ncbi:hypothetical protein AXG93_2490s1690 [Marchantia polymorpha subsp. ruderalis]|uniref:Reverse transcriptase Ty1/copia-type domain-containing protein n=1 Tax=Marchantia polymorpha subsp. ruderalis TaxID=1480154 RepID=A0A176W5R3_MARPO|nr:hypothetical protein AXG93_2490s1690 [Marchantia polymorpha subsp. ruderalis]